MRKRLLTTVAAGAALTLMLAACGGRSGSSAAGDTKTEAIRALRRRISDDVFRRLRLDEAVRSTALAAAA